MQEGSKVCVRILRRSNNFRWLNYFTVQVKGNTFDPRGVFDVNLQNYRLACRLS